MDGNELIKIVAFGDSITEGTYGGADESQVWTSLLKKMFEQANLKVEISNSGIPGETAPFGLRRFPYHVIAANPHIVLIMYGANDSYDPYGTGNPAVSVDLFSQSIEEMISRAQAHNILPMLMTTTPLFLFDELSDQQNALLGSYMDMIREIARKNNLNLIDHFSEWMGRTVRGEDVQQYLPDGVHPNAGGNQIIAETIFEPLSEIIKESSIK
jgi:lysophospholipase L1-like esterase